MQSFSISGAVRATTAEQLISRNVIFTATLLEECATTEVAMYVQVGNKEHMVKGMLKNRQCCSRVL